MDSPDPDKAGFILQSWHYVTAALAGVLAWLTQDTMSRIKALEANRLTKEEFKTHAEAMQKATSDAAEDLSKARHDLRGDMQKIVGAMELDRANLRRDMERIFDQQRGMGEDIATIKGRMK